MRNRHLPPGAHIVPGMMRNFLKGVEKQTRMSGYKIAQALNIASQQYYALKARDAKTIRLDYLIEIFNLPGMSWEIGRDLLEHEYNKRGKRK